MDVDKLEHKLTELVKEFGQSAELQHIKFNDLSKSPQNNVPEPDKQNDSLVDSIDLLRICIKYHLFDLEATRRECEYLKKLLEDKS